MNPRDLKARRRQFSAVAGAAILLAFARSIAAFAGCELQNALDAIYEVRELARPASVRGFHEILSAEATRFAEQQAVELAGGPRQREAFAHLIPDPARYLALTRSDPYLARVLTDLLTRCRTLEYIPENILTAVRDAIAHPAVAHPELPGKTATTLSAQDVDAAHALSHVLASRGIHVPVDIFANPMILEHEGGLFRATVEP